MKMVSSFTTKTPTIQVKPRRQESNAHPLDQYLLTKRKKAMLTYALDSVMFVPLWPKFYEADHERSNKKPAHSY